MKVAVPALRLTPKEVDDHACQLIKDYRCGLIDRDTAFTEIYGLAWRPMMTIFRSVCGVGDRDIQAELFQEVMIRFIDHEHSYDATKPFLPWLYKIARNVRCDFIRMRSRMEMTVLNADLQQRDSQNEDCLLTRIMIERALDHLPEIDRSVLLSSYYEERRDQEIADELNCSLAAVKFYLRRARQRLRDVLTSEQMSLDYEGELHV